MAVKNILIVEDDQSIREMMKDVLEIEGYTIFTATNGKEGIETLQKIKPSPCVVLLDMMMPIMNGWQFLDFQRSSPEYATIPVIVCSAYNESAKSVRPAAILSKPLQLKSLLGAVQSFCACA